MIFHQFPLPRFLQGAGWLVRILNVLLIFGLALSIALMATAANLISKWIKEYRWIAWIGILAILVVAIDLIYTDLKILI